MFTTLVLLEYKSSGGFRYKRGAMVRGSVENGAQSGKGPRPYMNLDPEY